MTDLMTRLAAAAERDTGADQFDARDDVRRGVAGMRRTRIAQSGAAAGVVAVVGVVTWAGATASTPQSSEAAQSTRTPSPSAGPTTPTPPPHDLDAPRLRASWQALEDAAHDHLGIRFKFGYFSSDGAEPYSVTLRRKDGGPGTLQISVASSPFPGAARQADGEYVRVVASTGISTTFAALNALANDDRVDVTEGAEGLSLPDLLEGLSGSLLDEPGSQLELPMTGR